MTAARWGAAALAALLAVAAPARAHVVEYLYVTANAGGSSGGHAAIRFDDRVYHFQQRGPEGLRLARTSAARFLHIYGVLENRTIHAARLPVSDDTYELLVDRFNARYLDEEKQFDVLAGLEDDRTLLATLAGATPRAEQLTPFPLRAAGLFDRTATIASPTLASLRDAIEATDGAGSLDARAAALARALRDLEPSPPAPPLVGADAYPLDASGFAETYRNLALARVAIDTLRQALPLDVSARRVLPGDEAVLTPTEAGRLRRLRERLRAAAADLVRSPRPDRGAALLVAMARLEAIDATLAGGHWVVLDAFPDDARTLPDVDRRFLEDLRTDATVAVRAARRALASAADPGERDYAGVEDAANRSIEVTRGITEGRSVRVHADALVPARALRDALVPAPVLDHEAVTRALGATSRAIAAHRAALRAAYGYDLVRRNCVSEIFATIDAALGREGSSARLGGWIDPHGGLVFWPWRSFAIARTTYATSEVTEIPSYRRARLAEMYRAEPPALAYLRESNTLTSTLYRHTAEDSFFLFFTDDLPATRPLYGVANVAAGLGELVVGLGLVPWDRGHTLWSGAVGVAASLPELAFFNVRKGSMAYGRIASDDSVVRIDLADDGGDDVLGEATARE